MSCPKHSVRPVLIVIAPASEGSHLPRHSSYHHFHLWRPQPGAMGNPNTLTARLPARRHIGPPPNPCNARPPSERGTQPPTAPGVDTPPCCPLRLGRIHAATYEPAAHVHCPVPLPISLPFHSSPTGDRDPQRGRGWIQGPTELRPVVGWPPIALRQPVCPTSATISAADQAPKACLADWRQDGVGKGFPDYEVQ